MPIVFFDFDLDRSIALSNIDLAAFTIVYLIRHLRCVERISELVFLVG